MRYATSLASEYHQPLQQLHPAQLLHPIHDKRTPKNKLRVGGRGAAFQFGIFIATAQNKNCGELEAADAKT